MNEVEGGDWSRSELSELACLLGIACCLWIIGNTLEVLPVLQRTILDQGYAHLVFLGFFMSFALVIASVLKSRRLRREMRARASAEEAAKFIARRDVLTGLPNRGMLIDEMRQAATNAPGRPWAAVMIGLDRFKLVNDLHGHAAGDTVLCEAAERIAALLPREAVTSRLGGDEFCAFMPCEPNGADVVRLAPQIIGRLSETVVWEQAKLDVGATLGIALWPQDGAEPEALLRSADIAMSRGKQEGRGTYRFFEASMDEELKSRVYLETALGDAIKSGEIRPHYQPLVELPGHALLGFEVLARWYHPTRGVIGPDIFIPIAEDTGRVGDLCYALLRRACIDARAWRSDITLSINISPCQFKDRMLAPKILAILMETGFQPTRLEVEITESALLNEFDVSRATISALQDAGVSIALDDFGTGYSSLYHLREMRFDKIKIDRSFVQSLAENGESAKIVSAILGLGQSLGIKTTAEGIETQASAAWLAERGCTYGQGYLFGPPVPANIVASMIESDRADRAAA